MWLEYFAQYLADTLRLMRPVVLCHKGGKCISKIFKRKGMELQG